MLLVKKIFKIKNNIKKAFPYLWGGFFVLVSFSFSHQKPKLSKFIIKEDFFSSYTPKMALFLKSFIRAYTDTRAIPIYFFRMFSV